MDKITVILVCIAVAIGLFGGYGLGYVIYEPRLESLESDLVLGADFLEELDSVIVRLDSEIEDLRSELMRLNSIIEGMENASFNEDYTIKVTELLRFMDKEEKVTNFEN